MMTLWRWLRLSRGTVDILTVIGILPWVLILLWAVTR